MLAHSGHFKCILHCFAGYHWAFDLLTFLLFWLNHFKIFIVYGVFFVAVIFIYLNRFLVVTAASAMFKYLFSVEKHCNLGCSVRRMLLRVRVWSWFFQSVYKWDNLLFLQILFFLSLVKLYQFIWWYLQIRWKHFPREREERKKES